VGASFSPASLFAAGEPGVWYDPSDFSTMFQDSVGTTPVTAVEQPVGLILDKSKGLALGPEIFSSFTSTGLWTVSGSTYSISSAASSTDLRVDFIGTVGKRYVISFTASGVSGGVIFYPLHSSPPNIVNGTNVTRELANVGFFIIRATTGASATVSNISVKELPGNHATQATSASRPVLSARVNLLTKTEQFDDAVWTKDGATVTAPTAIVAPDGTTTADLILDVNGDTGYHICWQAGAGTSGLNAARSVYVKQYSTTRYVAMGVAGVLSSAANTWIFDFDTGTFVITGSGGVSAAVENVWNGWYRISVVNVETSTNNNDIAVGVASGGASYTDANYLADGTRGVYVWGAQYNYGVDLPVYQRVNTSTDYDTTGFPYYLRFDGSDDSMATNTITPGIDKAQVFAGVRKLSDAAQGVVAEMSATIASNNGTFLLAAPDAASATFAFDSKGTTQVDAIASSLTAPLTRVVTGIGDISGDTAIIRINGVQADQETSDQGTGNFLAYPLYIGRRNNATLPFNGRIYSLITRFGANLDATTIGNTEQWISGKMGGGYYPTGYDFLVDANGDQITDASNNPLFTQALYT
jgi:hypothetical protein